MCKSSPFIYSFWLVILFGSLQLSYANNNRGSEQPNQNNTQQEQLTMVDSPASPAKSDELQMVDSPTPKPNSTARIEREGSLVDIADLGGGRTATPLKKEDNPKEEK